MAKTSKYHPGDFIVQNLYVPGTESYPPAAVGCNAWIQITVIIYPDLNTGTFPSRQAAVYVVYTSFSLVISWWS